RTKMVKMLSRAGIILLLLVSIGLRGADTLPSQIPDDEYWKLIAGYSEPTGEFPSENFTSNENGFQMILPDLLKVAKQGGVYLGVGPEQNFTYITALQPKIVFITDIRRGNMHTQLMYKALFDLAADRADFMSLLFTKKRPAGLTAKSSAHEIQQAFWDQATSDETSYKANLKAIDDVLTKKHELPLGKEDLEGIENVYHSFYWYGPRITYNSSNTSGNGIGGNFVNYADLMEATDTAGVARSFLANEENYTFMKELEAKNLLVPLVGNFAGPKALRGVAKYLKDH